MKTEGLQYSLSKQMRQHSFIHTSKGYSRALKRDSTQPEIMFLNLRDECIKPWEMGFFDIEQLIKLPAPHEQTFHEGTISILNQQPIFNLHSDQESASPTLNRLHTRPYKSKNKNVLKFVVKLLRDHSDIVRQSFGKEYADSFQKVHKYLRNLFEWHKESPSQNSINKDHLKQILEGIGEEAKLRSSRVRLALRSILSKHMGKLTLRNNRCRQKLVYLNALKVYQLRCCNPCTAMRFQS